MLYLLESQVAPKTSELIRSLILKDYFNKDNKEKFNKYTDTLLYLNTCKK